MLKQHAVNPHEERLERKNTMVTTALIVEIIVIGMSTLTWIVFFALAGLGLEFEHLKNIDPAWAPLLGTAGIVLAYQIGWVVDYVVYQFYYYLRGVQKIKQDHIGDNRWWEVNAAVHHRNSPATVATVRQSLSIVRITRTAVLNFILIGASYVALFGASKHSLIVAGICLSVALGFGYSVKKYWKHWYQFLEASFNVTRKDDELPAKYTAQPKLSPDSVTSDASTPLLEQNYCTSETDSDE